MNDFKAKKKFGQNFLIDNSIRHKICAKVLETSPLNVVEIGPGKGSLTSILLDSKAQVYAYEIDHDAVLYLNEKFQNLANFHIIEGDILESNLDDINSLKDAVLVSNLPYYITTPIITLYLTKLNINKAIFMVQKEVGERLTSAPSSKTYGAFSVICQYLSCVKKEVSVPRNAFSPAPDVDSMVISMEKKVRELPKEEDDGFFSFVYGCFKEKRKMLLNNLSSYLHLSKDKLGMLLDDLSISQTSRAENLSVEDFIKLYKAING